VRSVKDELEMRSRGYIANVFGAFGSGIRDLGTRQHENMTDTQCANAFNRRDLDVT